MIAPLTELAMIELISNSQQRRWEEQMTAEEIIEKWVRVGLDEADSYDFYVGEDISPYPQVKIAFDGYAEDEDGEADESSMSFAVYIHKDANTDGFCFPDHEIAYGAVLHRTSEEVYLIVWFDANDGSFDSQFLSDCAEEANVPYDQIVSVIEALDKRLSASEE